MHSIVTNVAGWVLTVCGALSFVVAAGALVYFAVTPDVRSTTEISTSLHDTYYIIHRSRGALIWPLLLCLALSASTAILGYMLTTHYVTRAVRERASVTSAQRP